MDRRSFFKNIILGGMAGLIAKVLPEKPMDKIQITECDSSNYAFDGVYGNDSWIYYRTPDELNRLCNTTNNTSLGEINEEWLWTWLEERG